MVGSVGLAGLAGSVGLAASLPTRSTCIRTAAPCQRATIRRNPSPMNTAPAIRSSHIPAVGVRLSQPPIVPEKYPSKPKIKIVGELPNPLNPPPGCAFHKRCPYATERCSSEEPLLRPLDNRQVACHYAEQFVA